MSEENKMNELNDKEIVKNEEKNITEISKIQILKLIGIYFLIYVVCSVLFVLMFHTGLLKGMDVLMYKGIVFIVITGIIASVIMGLLRMKIKYITIRDIIMVFTIFCCVNTTLFVLIPVTVERSVSVFMLSYMEENSDETFTEDEISQVFIDVYVNDFGAFEKRFHEQEVTGTIKEVSNGEYELTGKGKFIVNMFRTVSKWFNTDKRLVYPSSR